jgi:hypothetical protein
MKRVLFVALGALTLAGCESTDPARQRTNLDTINVAVDKKLAENPPVTQEKIVAAFSPYRQALAEIGKACATPTSLAKDALLLRCYSTAIEAYMHLAELPTADLGDLKPYLAAQGVANSARPLCQKSANAAGADCHAIAMWSGMIETGSAAAELASMALGPAPAVDAARAAKLFAGHAEVANANWPALIADATGTPGAGMVAGRKQALLGQACKVMWAGQILTPRMPEGAPFQQFNAAFTESTRTSAAALQISPCSDGGTTCAEAAPCNSNPTDRICLNRRALQLGMTCGSPVGFNR